MKLVKNASGKTVVNLSKEEWMKIGQNAGWKVWDEPQAQQPTPNVTNLIQMLGKVDSQALASELVTLQRNPQTASTATALFTQLQQLMQDVEAAKKGF